jgi:hypothetical protein
MAALVWIVAAAAYGQGANSRAMTVPFDNPGRPGVVRIVSGEGDVRVTGYSGRDVLIRSAGKTERSVPPENDPKAKGLKRITGSGFSVTTVREENAVVIARSMNDPADLEIQVPFNTTLRIGGKSGAADFQNLGATIAGAIAGLPAGPFEGDVTVENISGEMEIGTLSGDVTLKGISGGVVANSIDGDVTAVFKSMPGDRPIAFSTVDGDIDLTLPASARATVTARNVDGSVYTDFELDTIPGEVKRSERGAPGLGGVLTGPGGNTVSGKINGGGTSVQLRTVDGNIYIRKAK